MFSRCHAAAAFANRRQAFASRLAIEARTYAALKISPHPVGFAEATGNALALRTEARVKAVEPCPPRWTTTSSAPSSRSAAAPASTEESPERFRTSSSFPKKIDVCRRAESAAFLRCAGQPSGSVAMSRDVTTPALRAFARSVTVDAPMSREVHQYPARWR